MKEKFSSTKRYKSVYVVCGTKSEILPEIKTKTIDDLSIYEQVIYEKGFHQQL